MGSNLARFRAFIAVGQPGGSSRASNRNLATNLYCVGRQLKEIADMNGVALHQCEERLQPSG
jgi:hypothetical protein